MKKLAVALPAAALIAGCGGGREPPEQAAWVPNTEPVVAKVVGPASEYRYVPQKPLDYIPKNLPVVKAEMPSAVLAGDTPQLTLEDEAGQRLSSFQLEPVHGKGYPELKAVLTARAAGGTAPERVPPQCRGTASCEYALAKVHTLTASAPDAVKLETRGDGVAVVARELNVDTPRPVDLTLSVDGRVVARSRIMLMPG